MVYERFSKSLTRLTKGICGATAPAGGRLIRNPLLVTKPIQGLASSRITEFTETVPHPSSYLFRLLPANSVV